jgi:hypothetical protein
MDSFKEDEFYVTLQSNSSKHIFPKNVQSAFTNQLKKPLKLTDEWVVGITEVYFNSKTENKPHNKRKRSPKLDPPEAGNSDTQKDFPHQKLNKNDKPTLKIDETQRQVESHNQNIKTDEKKINELIHIESQDSKNFNTEGEKMDKTNGDSLHKSDEIKKSFIEKRNVAIEHVHNDSQLAIPSIASILEALVNLLNDKYTKKKDDLIVEKQPIEKLMYLYLDIIKPRFLGDQYVRCIRVIPSTLLDEIIRFNHIEYYPVELKYIESISILTNDEQGEKINFKDSFIPFYCTLHFKKIKKV